MVEQQRAADRRLVDALRRRDREQRVQLLAVGREALAAEHADSASRSAWCARRWRSHALGSHSSTTAILSASRSA